MALFRSLLTFAVLTIWLLPISGKAAGYYNLGAFWRPTASGPPPSCVTPAFVQAVDVQYLQAPGQSLALTGTAGNLVVVVAWGQPYLLPLYTVSDTLGSVWKAAPVQMQPSSSVQIFYTENFAGGSDTITVGQFNGNPLMGFFAAEYSGVATSNSVDISSGQIATGISTPSAGSMTTASDCPDLVVAAFEDGPPCGNWAAGSGFTQRSIDGCGSTALQDNIGGGLAAHGSVNAVSPETDYGDSSTWVGTQVAFRVQGSSAQAAPSQLAITTSSQNLALDWQCSGAITVQAQNGSGQPARTHTPITLNPSGSFSTYLDSACTVPLDHPQILAGVTSTTFYFSAGTQGTPTLSLAASGFTTVTQNATVTALDPFTWIGGAGCNGNWGTGACWKGGAAPGSNDTAHFDTNCTLNCTASLTADVTIKNLRMHPGTSATLNIGAHTLSVSGGDMRIEGGILNSGSVAINVLGSAFFTGGTTHLTNVFTLSGDLYIGPSATVTTTGSTVNFNDPNGGDAVHAIEPGGVQFNNVGFVDTNGGGWQRRSMSSAQTAMTVNGTLTWGAARSDGAFFGPGIVLAKGDVIFQGKGYVELFAPGELRIAGSGNQTVDATGTTTAYVPSIGFASTGGQVTVKGTINVYANYTFTSGNVDFSSQHSTLAFNDYDCYSDVFYTITPGNATYNNVSLIDAPGCNPPNRTLGSTDVMKVSGTLTLGSVNRVTNLNGGRIDVTGDVKVQDLGATGTTEIKMAGTGTQSFDASATTTAYVPNLTLASVGPVVFKGSPLVYGNYTFSSGSADFTTNHSVLGFYDDTCANHNWTVSPGNATYYDVIFEDLPVCGAPIRTLGASDFMVVQHTLTLNGQGRSSILFGGSITVGGDFVILGEGYEGDTEVLMNGNNTRLLDASGATNAHLPSLKISTGGGGTTTVKGTPIVHGNYTYIAGTVDFTSQNSTLAFDDRFCTNNTSWSITPGTVTYKNVSFQDEHICGGVKRNLQVGSTMIVGGDLAFKMSQNASELDGGTLAVTGNVVVSDGAYIVKSDVQVGGNWQNSTSAPFTALAGTVSFTAGADHSISGNNIFYNLTMANNTVATANTLTLPASNNQTINGTLNLRGNSTHSLSVVSSASGVAAVLGFATVPQTMGGNLSIQDCKPSAGTLHTGANSTLISDYGTGGDIWVSP